MTNTRELGERLRLSRERLAGSELANQGQAWRLWAACVDATVGYSREADLIYVSTLARNAAGVHRNATARIMRRFHELEVFSWIAAPPGSHAISELRLPTLMHSSRCMTEVHAPPTVHDEPSSCTAHGALQPTRNTSESLDCYAIPIQREDEEAGELVQTGTPKSGTHDVGPPDSFRAMLEGLTIEELHHGVAEYGPVVAELYADELERRNVAPRRRPAWLDWTDDAAD
jgi:hypothetical protein